MLAHPEIVVGAPDQHFTRTVRPMPDRLRKSSRQPFQFGKYPVAVLIPDAGQCVNKKSVVFHFELDSSESFLDGRYAAAWLSACPRPLLMAACHCGHCRAD